MRETRAAVLLLYITAVAGQSLDVCSSCHADATCDDKTDGSGKVCNCKYGFVGNGRTFCQDKDECQIGSAKICGQHTTCHNTYGSYFCTCLSGYRPTNNMTTFIPNDGTNCQDIDECEVRGVCGEGARCINLEGSFECRCQNGFRVSDGAEPFHPRPDKAKCKVVDCGPPASPEDCVLVSVTKTTFEGRAVFECEKGFIWRGGNNSSVCEASGRWTAPSLVCEEVDCGPPPVRLHSETLWDGGSRAGSEVLYRCNSGYQAVPLRDTFHCNSTGQWDVPAVLCQETLCGNPPVVENSVSVWDGTSAPGGSVGYYCKHGFSDRGGGNTSVCNELGEWTQPTLSCQEISCGLPRQAPNALMLWDGLSSVGSLVIYRCNFGYQNTGNKNDSSCQENGEWTNPAVVCQEIICGQPTDKANTKTIWDGTAGVGAVAHYECNEGYYASTLKNTSKCEENGLWEDIDLKCEEISCGSPFLVPNTNLRWDGSSVPGSVAVYRCEEGFYPESERSTCSNTGQWGQVSLICNAKCGPVPPLAHAEVLWQNRSVALHRCEAGYHSWTGSSTSTCDHSGLWNQATIKCIKFKPPISQLRVLDDRCLHWNAEKFEESTEVYTIRFTGSRDYQASFLDKRRRILSSQADRVEICLNLLPATNYSISVTAASSKVTVSISTNTSLTAPAAPVVHFREYETPLPTLALVRSPNTMDPISVYHVHVLPVDGLMVFDCSSPSSSENEDPRHYVAAQIQVKDLGTEMSFNVGDGRFYGGYMNAPLENGKDYYIILRAFAEWRKESKSTCVVWAKVKGSSYVLTVSSLSAAAVVGLVALTFLGGYSYFGFFKKL